MTLRAQFSIRAQRIVLQFSQFDAEECFAVIKPDVFCRKQSYGLSVMGDAVPSSQQNPAAVVTVLPPAPFQTSKALLLLLAIVIVLNMYTPYEIVFFPLLLRVGKNLMMLQIFLQTHWGKENLTQMKINLLWIK